MPIGVHSSPRLGRYGEALNIVHANPCGNDTAIFTNDSGAARGFTHEAEAGMVGVTEARSWNPEDGAVGRRSVGHPRTRRERPSAHKPLQAGGDWNPGPWRHLPGRIWVITATC